MKFTFKCCGSYTWAMGNKVDEDGSFFEISHLCGTEDRKIIKNYGCGIAHGSKVFGTEFTARFFLFVPENVYPIMETMFEEMRKSDKEKKKYWEGYYESRKKEQEEKLNKLREFVDPKVPIEV